MAIVLNSFSIVKTKIVCLKSKKDMSRNFVIESSDIGQVGTYYTGKTPASAAKKAARALYNKTDKKKVIRFELRETGSKLIHHYEAKMLKLKEPKVITRGGKDITITREFKVTWLARTNPDCQPTLFTRESSRGSSRSRSPSPSRK